MINTKTIIVPGLFLEEPIVKKTPTSQTYTIHRILYKVDFVNRLANSRSWSTITNSFTVVWLPGEGLQNRLKPTQHLSSNPLQLWILTAQKGP